MWHSRNVQRIITQKFISKLQKIRKKYLADKIESIQSNPNADFGATAMIERELTQILDTELRDGLAKTKIFEILNAERASPHFLSLAKKNLQKQERKHAEGQERK